MLTEYFLDFLSIPHVDGKKDNFDSNFDTEITFANRPKYSQLCTVVNQGKRFLLQLDHSIPLKLIMKQRMMEGSKFTETEIA